MLANQIIRYILSAIVLIVLVIALAGSIGVPSKEFDAVVVSTSKSAKWL